MQSKNVKILRWITCDNGTYIDDEQITRRYELIATDADNSKYGIPYDPSEVYLMKIVGDHPPIFDFPEAQFFGKDLVWKCNMELFDTWQEMRTGDGSIKDGIVNIYIPKAGVKLSDIFDFDIVE